MRAHILVDGENVSSVSFDDVYKQLAKKYTIAKLSIFGSIGKIGNKFKKFKKIGAKMYDTYVGKNSADMLLTTALMKAVYCEVTTEVFILVSNDRDFSAVISAVASERKIIVVSNNIKDHSHLNMFGAKADNISFLELQNKSDVIASVPALKTTNDFKAKPNTTTVLVMWEGELREVPFYAGINVGEWNRILALNGIKIKKGHLREFVESNCLMLSANYVHFEEYEEEEIVK